jgi:hypothetical protein
MRFKVWIANLFGGVSTGPYLYVSGKILDQENENLVYCESY